MNGRIYFAKLLIHPVLETIKIEQGIFADGDNKYIDKLVFKKGRIDPVVSYPFTITVGKKQKDRRITER